MHHLWPCGQVHWCALPPRPPPHAPLLAAHAERVALVSCAVPGGPNKPDQGAIPPVPPGPAHNPNLTPPTIDGITVAEFRQVAHAPSTPPARRTPDARTSPSGRGRRHPTTTSRPHVTGARCAWVSEHARACAAGADELLRAIAAGRAAGRRAAAAARQRGPAPRAAGCAARLLSGRPAGSEKDAAGLGRDSAARARALAAPRAAAAPSRPRRAPQQHMQSYGRRCSSEKQRGRSPRPQPPASGRTPKTRTPPLPSAPRHAGRPAAVVRASDPVPADLDRSVAAHPLGACVGVRHPVGRPGPEVVRCPEARGGPAGLAWHWEGLCRRAFWPVPCRAGAASPRQARRLGGAAEQSRAGHRAAAAPWRRQLHARRP